MLRSLHTVSSGARHAIQPHLLSIQFLFLRSFVYKTAAKPNPKKKRSVINLSLHGHSHSHSLSHSHSQCVFFFFYRFVYKTTAMPNTKKKRSVIYPSLYDVLDARNAMQPRRKERSSAECAAATLCLPHWRVGSPLRVLLSIGFTSVICIYIWLLPVC